MHFGLTEEQQAIKNTARKFFAAECPIAEVRRLSETPTAYDAKLWAKFAEQGWTGIIFPEEYDGFGLGMVEMTALLEEMGAALAPGPFLNSVLLAGTVLDRCASVEQKRKYLALICRGEARATLALLERSASWDPARVEMSARVQASGGFVLEGEKLFVGDAGVADFLVVAARVDGTSDLAVFAVPAGVPGMVIDPTPGVDTTRPLYRVSFSGTPVASENLLARGEAARAALEAALDVATLGVVAEIAGGLERLVNLTVAYAKTRKQFGKPIGTFQAVQHQCVDMLVLLEGTRSAAYYAAWALSHNDPGARTAVSVAKAYASDAYREAGNRSIQVQGGMGFTWENDTHLYYRRARASELLFGDATFHRERIARSLLRAEPAEQRRDIAAD